MFSGVWQREIRQLYQPPTDHLKSAGGILSKPLVHFPGSTIGMLTEQRLIILNAPLAELIRSLGGCDRIRNTPLPIAYMLHIKRFLSLFCLTISLPFVAVMGWWSVLATALISYAFIGIEEIGVEIEDPFGDDPNDLPLDKICTTIEQNLADLSRLAERTL